MITPESVQQTCPKCNLRSWVPRSVSYSVCACGTTLKDATTETSKEK